MARIEHSEPFQVDAQRVGDLPELQQDGNLFPAALALDPLQEIKHRLARDRLPPVLVQVPKKQGSHLLRCRRG